VEAPVSKTSKENVMDRRNTNLGESDTWNYNKLSISVNTDLKFLKLYLFITINNNNTTQIIFVTDEALSCSERPLMASLI
jgi:hypothetical protein